MKLYLAHPYKIRKDIRKKELEFESKTKIDLFNPFVDGMETKGWVNNKKEGKKIVEKDLKYIKECDGMLAIFDNNITSYGTPMELFYAAKILKKPIYSISNHKGHPWILGLSVKVFKNWKEVKEYFC